MAQTLQLLSEIITAYEGSLQSAGQQPQQQQSASVGDEQQQQDGDSLAGVLGTHLCVCVLPVCVLLALA